MKANKTDDGEKEMDMFREEVTITLNPFYCCGSGCCGPLPGYSFICPHCKRDVQCRTGYPLKVGQRLNCRLCKGEITAVKQIAEFIFEFEYDRVASAVWVGKGLTVESEQDRRSCFYSSQLGYVFFLYAVYSSCSSRRIRNRSIYSFPYPFSRKTEADG